jgi:hypothetical protein
MCDVPSIAVFCSESIEWLLLLLLLLLLSAKHFNIYVYKKKYINISHVAIYDARHHANGNINSLTFRIIFHTVIPKLHVKILHYVTVPFYTIKLLRKTASFCNLYISVCSERA